MSSYTFLRTGFKQALDCYPNGIWLNEKAGKAEIRFEKIEDVESALHLAKRYPRAV